MGADISLFKQCLGNKECRFGTCSHYHSIVVKGPTLFRGRSLTIPDLRAGFAYVMAGLIASGETTISGVYFLDRGYERIVEKLQSVGARCERITEDEPQTADQSVLTV